MVKLLREFIDAVLQEGRNELEVVNQRSMRNVVNSAIDYAIQTLKSELVGSKECNVEAGPLERSLGRFRLFYLTEIVDSTGTSMSMSVGVYVSYGHNGTKLFDPDISVQLMGQLDRKERKFERSIEERLQSMLVPAPASMGLWWADENLYLKRPLLLGESPKFPPKKGWTAVDEQTYEPWNSKAKRR